MYEDESKRKRTERKELPKLNEMICPKCGRSSKEVSFHGFICMDDFLAEKKIEIPSSIIIQICKEGDKIAVRKWATELEEIKQQIKSLVKIKGAEVKCNDINLDRRTVTIDIIFDNDEKNKITKIIPLEIRNTFCDIHTKAVRGYYESIIQIRPPEKWKSSGEEKEKMEQRMKRMADKIISMLQLLNQEIYIKSETLKKGYDLYTSSTATTFMAMSELKLKPVVSKKLWTAKNGKELYRYTFLIRIID